MNGSQVTSERSASGSGECHDRRNVMLIVAKGSFLFYLVGVMTEMTLGTVAISS